MASINPYNEQATICENLRRLGYAQHNRIRLYGEVFELVSDPVRADGVMVVDAVEQRSGQTRRLPIPLSIIQMARQEHAA